LATGAGSGVWVSFCRLFCGLRGGGRANDMGNG
jgi:hypothetical protein